jgi:hypothetical protein
MNGGKMWVNLLSFFIPFTPWCEAAFSLVQNFFTLLQNFMLQI